MPGTRQEKLQIVILQLLPADHSGIGNLTLLQKIRELNGTDTTDAEFQAARDALVASGQAIKGKGRGGSTALVAVERPVFDLQAEPTTDDLLAPTPTPERKPAKPKATPVTAAPGEPQVISYRHPDRRKNNPEVGLVNETSDPQQPKTVYAYDPHLDPVLQFDSARARGEKLIDDALAGNDPAAMRSALEELRRLSSPYLQWTGKAERTSFEVDTVSLHVHERIDAMSILSAVSKRQDNKDKKAATGGAQPGLFEAPFESLPLRDAVDFYKHDRGWANRLVAGDSLLVMNSLLQKESMAGQVQMIYIDPPYGIKYGSNFQPFTNKRDVKDRSDADLTQEPEMIKAFRDTWELGIHSYLTYLRDRLLLAKDLLSETGSVFVQISDENLHLVRNLMDEVFGVHNYCSTIQVQKTGSQAGALLGATVDFLLWYGKDKASVKYRQLYVPREKGDKSLTRYDYIELTSGTTRRATKPELHGKTDKPEECKSFRFTSLISDGKSNTDQIFRFRSHEYAPKSTSHWKTSVTGLDRLAKALRVYQADTTVHYKRYLNDFPVTPIDDRWESMQIGKELVYVVQTADRVIERCMLMTTDPGDLVLDPTCGSGTTAYVAEKWGRRWLTCDTSRVAITLTKQRLITASFDYFELRYPHEGLKGGFIYKTVPHVTLKSIANNAEIDTIYERLHPGIEAALEEFNACMTGEPPTEPFTITEGARKGQKVKVGHHKDGALLEWEMPFDYPEGWNPEAQPMFIAFHTARQKCRRKWIAALPRRPTTKRCTTSPKSPRTNCASPARSRSRPYLFPPCYHLRSILRTPRLRKRPIWLWPAAARPAVSTAGAMSC